MKITIESPPPGGEEEIIIRADKIDDRIMALIQALKSDGLKLAGFSQSGQIRMLSPDEIFYFESVDNKVFAYCEREVSELKYKLYELEERFAGTDFIRISKSMILNISKVERFAPSIGGRFEAILLNGEKTVISRQYVQNLKKQLGI